MTDKIPGIEDFNLDSEKPLTCLEKSVVYCIKILNELVDAGIIEGKPYEVTEKGLKEIKDFDPTDEELKDGMLVLKSQGLVEFLEFPNNS